MSADALLRVGRALKALIEAEAEVGPEKVVLGPPPVARSRLDGPRLGLFLYRIQPSAELRQRPRPMRPAAPGDLAELRPGLPLELRFLLTAFGPEDETGFGAEQLILLGAALRAVGRTAVLVGDAVGSGEVRLTLDPLSSEELSRIWGLFPETSFQTSVGLLAAPVWIDLVAAPEAAPVTGARIRLGVQRE